MSDYQLIRSFFPSLLAWPDLRGRWGCFCLCADTRHHFNHRENDWGFTQVTPRPTAARAPRHNSPPCQGTPALDAIFGHFFWFPVRTTIPKRQRRTPSRLETPAHPAADLTTSPASAPPN
eukprot:762290-Pyramimonas_sp.AAC.1